MRYYTLDENGLPMTTDATEIVEDWIERDLVIFDTIDDKMIPTGEEIQERSKGKEI